MMDRRYMVKQFLGEVYAVTPWGSPVQYRVFNSGLDGWLLFDRIDGAGCSMCEQFPVKASDLKPHVRRALKAGVTFTTAARNRLDTEHRLRRTLPHVGAGDAVTGD